jgi:hypothetical protein
MQLQAKWHRLATHGRASSTQHWFQAASRGMGAQMGAALPLGALTWSCWSILDRGSVPQPVEDASEAAWREFDACWEAMDRRVRETGWGPLPDVARARGVRGPASAKATARPAAAVHVDDVMQLARTNDRVCPTPAAWMRLHQLLRVLVPARPTDPAPAALDATEWEATTDLQKRLRLREQLAWAQHHAGLHVAHEFLRALHEDDWHHHTPLHWPTL